MGLNARPALPRLPGCDERCIEAVVMRRLEVFHDPKAHEEHGVRSAGGCTDVVRTGPLEINLTDRTVTRFGQEVPVTALAWQVLALLATKPGRLCHWRELAWALHGQIVTDGGGVTNESVRGVIFRLRIALRDCGYLVESHCRRGYRLLIEPTDTFRGEGWRWHPDYDGCVSCGRSDRPPSRTGICGNCATSRSRRRLQQRES